MRAAFGTAQLMKYTEVAAITIRSRFAYLWDLVGSCLFLAVIMFVFVQLWTLTYASQGETVAGFTLAKMIWYLVAAESIIMSMQPIHRVIEREIREGDVATRLNKPYSYLLFHGSVFIGEALVKALVLWLIGGAIAGVMVGGFAFHTEAVPLLFVTWLITWSINFCYSALIGLAAFWMEDVTGLFFIMDRVKWLLGGFFMPITLFPEPLATIAEWLPYRYMIFEPARLVVDFEFSKWLQVSGAQLGVLAVFGLTAHFVYRRGVRRLNLNGG